MSKFISFLIIGLLSFGLVVSEASAKRFGSGRSFGIQRPSSGFSFSKAAPNKFSQNPNRNRWGGLVGGLLIGGLLTSLFMKNGLATGLLTWLIIGGLILFVISLFRRASQPNYQTAANTSFSPNFQNPFSASNFNQRQEAYPSSFNVDNFLREAKIKFMRLQAAYDQKNLDDLREFTSPEVMAEIQMQLQERGDEPSKTDVLSLDAQLLDLLKEDTTTLASVLFTGSVKEDNQNPENFNEIWHFRQYSNKEWLVCGVQQER